WNVSPFLIRWLWLTPRWLEVRRASHRAAEDVVELLFVGLTARAARLADEQWGREEDPPRRVVAPFLDPLEQQPRRRLADLVSRLGDGREAWPQHDRPLEVVEADDRQVVRYPDAARLQGGQRAERHEVVGGEDGGRRRRQVEQLQHPAVPAVEP